MSSWTRHLAGRRPRDTETSSHEDARNPVGGGGSTPVGQGDTVIANSADVGGGAHTKVKSPVMITSFE